MAEIIKEFGSSTMIASVDLKTRRLGSRKIVAKRGLIPLGISEAIIRCEQLGFGEILVTDVDREGTMRGLDLSLFDSIAKSASVPVIAMGGAGTYQDVSSLLFNTSIDGVACGSLFAFSGPHKAVLINYPSIKFIEEIYSEQ